MNTFSRKGVPRAPAEQVGKEISSKRTDQEEGKDKAVQSLKYVRKQILCEWPQRTTELRSM